MGFDFLCESCGKRLTVPPGLYEKRVRGRVVTIGCKACGAPIRIDATEPPPAGEATAETEASPAAATDEVGPESASSPHDRATFDISKVGRLPENRLESFESLRPPEFTGAQPSWSVPSPDMEVDAGWEDSGRSTPPPPLVRELAAEATHLDPVSPSSDPARFDSAPAPCDAEPEAGTPPEPALSSPPSADSAHPESQHEFADESSVDEEAPTISHVTGPISARAPMAKLGRYTLFDKFASGGMATVHLGRLDGIGGFSRVVAIKRLLPHLVQNEEFSKMLLNEARLAARVRHPNVVPTLDVVSSMGEVLLVLEYVHGESLSALCRAQAKQRGVIPVGVAVSILLGLLQGLHAVHEATDERGRSLGLVHRDVSPQNVMVGVDGIARVVDFGIVKALEQIEETGPTRLKGKAGYMSPEQIRGERLTRSSDIFAAGIVLWEMLTLRRFSPAASDRERVEWTLSGNYARPGSLRPDISSTLDEIVMRALSFDAKNRYMTARAFADALSHSGEETSASAVADWVQRLAEKALFERARLLAQVENWSDSQPEPELDSAPLDARTDALETSVAPSDPGARRSRPRGSRTPRTPAVSTPQASAGTAAGAPGPDDRVSQAGTNLPSGQNLSVPPWLDSRPFSAHLSPDSRARNAVALGALLLISLLLYLFLK